MESKTFQKYYFKKIYVNFFQDGGLIICGNHSNQFIDPMILMAYLKRPISMIIAKKSYDKLFIGGLAKIVNSIPVIRQGVKYRIFSI